MALDTHTINALGYNYNQYNLSLPLGMVETRRRYGSVAEFLKTTNQPTTTTTAFYSGFVSIDIDTYTHTDIKTGVCLSCIPLIKVS